MPTVSPVYSGNQLLALLPPKERKRIFAEGEFVDLTFGDVLCEQGERMRQVYFPVTGFISLLTTVDDQTLEVGMIGDEGLCGHSLALGVETAPLRALVQGSGKSVRLKASIFLEHLATSTALRKLMNIYIHVLLGQLAQASACTRFHTVDARLARWLLMTQDRAHADAFDVTQDFLAFMLGVRRVGVSAAARVLQSQKLIHYVRGHITVLDREGLEAASCVCYQSDLDIYQSALGTQKTPARFHVPAAVQLA